MNDCKFSQDYISFVGGNKSFLKLRKQNNLVLINTTATSCIQIIYTKDDKKKKNEKFHTFRTGMTDDTNIYKIEEKQLGNKNGFILPTS